MFIVGCLANGGKSRPPVLLSLLCAWRVDTRGLTFERPYPLDRPPAKAPIPLAEKLQAAPSPTSMHRRCPGTNLRGSECRPVGTPQPGPRTKTQCLLRPGSSLSSRPPLQRSTHGDLPMLSSLLPSLSKREHGIGLE